MKSINVQLYLLLLIFTLFITPQCSAKAMTESQMVTFIRPIEPLAMQFGTGRTKVYLFVDPKCRYSRDFISSVYENENMRSNYRYYIFFYELKRLKSHDLIGTIYASSSPLEKTIRVMMKGKEMVEHTSFSQKIEERIDSIESVAKAIGVKKRPYLIINKELD